MEACKTCEGTGAVEVFGRVCDVENDRSETFSERFDCPDCWGSGEIEAPEEEDVEKTGG